MPCYHPEPSDLDESLNTTCRNLVYLIKSSGGTPPPWAVKYSSEWGEDQDAERKLLDLATQILCAGCAAMNDADKERIMFARNKEARALANWWEDHQEFDKKRTMEAKP